MLEKTKLRQMKKVIDFSNNTDTVFKLYSIVRKCSENSTILLVSHISEVGSEMRETRNKIVRKTVTK